VKSLRLVGDAVMEALFHDGEIKFRSHIPSFIELVALDESTMLESCVEKSQLRTMRTDKDTM